MKIKNHRTALLILLSVFSIIYAIVAKLENGFIPLFPAGSDLSVHVAVTLSLKDPALFHPEDHLINGYKAFFPLTLAKLLNQFPDIRTALITLAVLLSIVLVTGLYFLSFRITRSHVWSIFVALLSLKIWPGLNTLQWGGIYPEFVFPRTVIIALSPWLLLWTVTSNNLLSRLGLFFVFGILFNVHPMASHLVLLALLAWSIQIVKEKNPAKAIGQIAALLAVFFVGASPSLIKVFSYTFSGLWGASVSHESVTTIPERSLHFLQFYWPAMFAFLLAIGPFLALSVAGLISKRHSALDQQNIVIALAIVVLTFSFLILGEINPNWPFGEFPRSSVYLFPLCMTYAFFGISRLWDLKWKKLAIAISIFLLLHHGSFYRIVLGMERATPRTKWVPQEFIALSDYAHEHSPKGTLFLVPPEGIFDLWRFYAYRSTVIHWKGIYSYRDWSLFQKAKRIYDNHTENSLCEFAKDQHADYVITQNELREEPSNCRLSRMKSSGSYTLFQVKYN